MPAKYDHIDFAPPKGVREAADRGLRMREAAPKSKKGGLSTREAGKQGIGSGVARASQLKKGGNVSPRVVRQMSAFFARHEKNKSTPKGRIAWLLWGGDAGRSWANKIVRQMDAADERG